MTGQTSVENEHAKATRVTYQSKRFGGGEVKTAQKYDADAS
jgi:hypothetical protein